MPSTFPYKLLQRSKNFAISSRSDLDWSGESIIDPTEREKKQNQLTKLHLSTKLYDWCLCPAVEINKLLSSSQKFGPATVSVIYKDTLEGVQYARDTLRKDGHEIAWLNFANAHNVGGSYNKGMGTQEENTITACTAAASLTIQAEPKPIDNAIKKWILANQKEFLVPVKYRDHRHLPPAGTYICKTRLFNVQPHIECYMIGSASADLREKTDFRPYTERDQLPSASDYEKRIMLDMEAVCLTAIKYNIKVLILGATGCGAFLHNPDTEAQLWKRVIEEKFGTYFEHIIFSILGQKNYQTFLNYFPNSNL